MVIRNKFLNISSDDIKKETNIQKLYKWLLEIDENIISMDIIIGKHKSSVNDDNIEWFNRVVYARKFQGVLKNIIQYRISEIKSAQRPLSEYIIDIIKPTISNDDWEIILKKAQQLKRNIDELSSKNQ